MKILLVRPDFKNLMTGSNIVTVEPLDLEYLAAVCTEEAVTAEIYDGQISRKRFSTVLRKSRPDLVAITGYVTMVPTILRYARIIKALNPAIRVMIGGAHAELNYRDFYCPDVDVVVHSGGVETFRKLIRLQKSAEPMHKGVDGICYRAEDGTWIETERATFDPNSLPLPDRSHFYAHRRRFKYMQYQPCAVVKTSYGCPFQCNFCYCCLMNNGQFTDRELTNVVAEIEGIDCEHVWIVDDTFLVSRERVLEFVRLIRERGLHRKWIIYSRADFVAANEDLIPLLKEVGVVEVIFGLEAVDDTKLKDYNKRTSDAINRKAVRVLNEWEINCVGLFMVDLDATKEDFTKILTWVKAAGLRQFLTSIFTPFPGTPPFEEYEDRLLTRNYEKWDLLHLVLRPTRLSRWQFYYQFYKLYVIMTWMNLRSGDYSLRYWIHLPPRKRQTRGK